MFNKTQFHDLTDQVAYCATLVEDLIGAVGESGTLLDGVASLVSAVQSLSDAPTEGPLLVALDAAQACEVPSLRYRFARAFAQAMAGVTAAQEGKSLSEWYGSVRSRTDRIAPEFAQLLRAAGGDMDAEQVYPPAGTELGSLEAPGGADDEELVSAPIDTNQYGGGLVEAYINSKIELGGGGTKLTVKVVGEQAGGGYIEATGEIPHNQAGGSTVPLEIAGGGFFVKVTAITATPDSGTWSSGKFTVRTIRDRDLT